MFTNRVRTVNGVVVEVESARQFLSIEDEIEALEIREKCDLCGSEYTKFIPNMPRGDEDWVALCGECNGGMPV